VIPYARQDVQDADVAAVAAALRDEFLTQGPKVAAFEEQLAAAVGARFAVAVSSGTAALHAAYAAAGVGPGRLVLTSPITFVATANASLYLGGGVAFADVDGKTVLLDPESAAAEAPPDTTVIAPVHFAGQAAPMEALAALAAARGWTVVEDAAHALGASYVTPDGREHRVGACAHSAMCCLSFHPVKHITTGEGGAVTTNSPALYARLKRFRSHGITREAVELTIDEGPWYYEQVELGYNYRLADFQCALGGAQLRRLDAYVGRRRAIAARYDALFRDAPGVRATEVPAWSRGSYHLYVVRVAASVRRRVFEGLRAAGIGVNVHYVPVYRQPYYRAHGFATLRLEQAEGYYREAISLPMYATLTDLEVDRVAAEVAARLAAAGVV
jgi:UDP-4-amino-4,6-dideoxy-N-acetyl-beta-L-altrosamine transaminase